MLTKQILTTLSVNKNLLLFGMLIFRAVGRRFIQLERSDDNFEEVIYLKLHVFVTHVSFTREECDRTAERQRERGPR